MPEKRRKPSPAKRRKSVPRRRKKFDPEDPHWIPGIHDYCDRWCERCDFSHRCFRFALTERILGTVNSRRISASQSVLDALTRMFAESQHDIAEIAKQLGKGADDRRVAAHIAVEKRIQRKALTSGGRETKAALTYIRVVDEWFNNEVKIALGNVRSLETRVQKGLIRVTDAKGILVQANDSIEVIRWHQHLPYVKLCRAFTSRVEEDAAGERLTQRDSDGSAKVALLSVDQSIDAWSQLSEVFPEMTDGILEILVRLDRLRRAIERRFPRARKFKRPGFDEKRRRAKATTKPRKKSR